MASFIALAKARPGKFTCGSSGTGSTAHLALELFNYLAGTQIMHVPYKGSGPTVNAVMAGEAQLCFITASNVIPHIASGKLRGLAVTSLQPSALAPGLPTVAAAGLPEYEIIGADAMFAPPKTPSSVINRLNREITRILGRPEVAERFFQSRVEAVGGPPEQLAARMKSDTVRLGKMIANAGIQAD